MSIDLKFIRGNFDLLDFPPELQFLEHYFQPDLPRMLAIYYLEFKNLLKISDTFFLEAFVDHTGLSCSGQRLRYLLKRIEIILDTIEKAKESMDIELMDKIRSGEWKFDN